MHMHMSVYAPVDARGCVGTSAQMIVWLNHDRGRVKGTRGPGLTARHTVQGPRGTLLDLGLLGADQSRPCVVSVKSQHKYETRKKSVFRVRVQNEISNDGINFAVQKKSTGSADIFRSE